MNSPLRTNRTGLGMSPVDANEMMAAAREAAPTTRGNAEDIAVFREQYIAEREAIGSMPPPTTPTGLLAAAVQVARSHHLNVFFDKLGERLAFERTGVRLYEALLSHVEVLQDREIGPSVQEVRTLRDEERRHFDLLREVVGSLGGDPTVETPAADAAAVETSGLLQVLADPRSSRSQCLHAILVAELADHEGWESLVGLARTLGHDDVAARFEVALQEERAHLARVRAWLAAQVQADATTGRVGVEA